MKDRESEFQVRFGVTPFLDVPKIEHHRMKESEFEVRISQDKTGPKGQ